MWGAAAAHVASYIFSERLGREPLVADKSAPIRSIFGEPMPERRSFVRYVLWFPVTIDSQGTKIASICRDASPGGMLVSAAAMLAAGGQVTCQFRLSVDSPEELAITGKVIRSERNADELELVFPFRVGITFDPPRTDLEEQLRHAQAHLREPR